MEKGEENRLIEDKLRLLKQEYEKIHMSDEQLKQLQLRIKEANMENKKQSNRRKITRLAAAAAVFAAIIMILPNMSADVAYAMEQIPVLGKIVKVVTFRDYKYETEKNMADIKVPELKLDGQVQDSEAQKKLERTTDEINAEIQEITGRLIKEFESSLEQKMEYQDIVVSSEVLATTQDYFTLKLLAQQGSGSSYQWNHYYTIDLNTGERLQLKDLFVENADYITPISENIKQQMREQMAADEMVTYWLDSDMEEMKEWDFKAITDDTSFYLNGDNHLVIGFDEGEVGPMSMGTVEFEIPDQVIEGIRK